MKRSLFTLVALFIVAMIHSQGCLPAGIQLYTQSQINNFPQNYPDCTVIEGDLTISGSNVYNLDSLIQLSAVMGNLTIGASQANNLTSIEGLGALTSIGGNLKITTVNSLTSLNGLEQLESVGGDAWFSAALLQNFEDLSALSFIGGDVRLVSLSNLESFAGLESIGSTIRGNLYINSCVNLESLSGLSFIEYVEGDFELLANSNLQNLEGLNNIDSIGGNFKVGTYGSNNIYGNQSLINFIGLDSLKHIGGDFIVAANSSLVDFTGLDQLYSVGGMFNSGSNTIQQSFYGLLSLEHVGIINIDASEIMENLYGLESLLSVEGSAYIHGDNLLNLDGLNNLQSIGSVLNLTFMDSLSSLIGLESLNSIGASLYVYQNPNLQSLQGLDNLLSIGGEFNLRDNDKLNDLSGLGNLNHINGSFEIYNNYDLVDLNGLENLEIVAGILKIRSNALLSNIDGISNIQWENLSGIEISYNPILNSCAVASVCDYIHHFGENMYLFNNGQDCSSIAVVSDACSIGPCLVGGIEFSNQADIDNFNTSNAYCDAIDGDVLISGVDISNLDGLSTLVKIGGDLRIKNNPVLVDINGLSHIDSIDGSFTLDSNIILTSIAGLENLVYIGADLSIDNNDSLSNILELIQLNHINGDLRIENNYQLESLKGIRNIASTGITNLYINDNSSLSECDVQSVCEYIGTPSGLISIANNNSNCNSQAEVELACEYGPCLTGGYTFNSQQSIDYFKESFPTCDIIEGDVVISSTSSWSPISNLDSLENIVKIEGNLNIGAYNQGNPYLLSLHGLDSLESIEGNLTLYSDSLTSFSGLASVKQVHSVYIRRNKVLKDLSGLEGITSVVDLQIGDYSYSNDSLNSIQQIANISSISGSLSISNCPQLSSFTGLENISEIGANLSISNNNAMPAIIGLENLTHIGENFYLSANTMLFSLSGLENLQSIGESIFLYSSSLSDFSSLSSLDNYGGITINSANLLESLEGLPYADSLGYVNINNCPLLSTLAVFDSTRTIEYLNLMNLDTLLEFDSFGNLDSVYDIFRIENNDRLESLHAFDSLSFIGNEIIIKYNPVLNDLSGLNSVNGEQLSEIQIRYNPELALCNTPFICNAVNDPNLNIFYIQGNAEGCNNTSEIEETCAGCLNDGVVFSSQEEIDAFPLEYNNCATIYGDVLIEGENITNVDSLIYIAEIEGYLYIGDSVGNPLLEDLNGLANLQSIGGDLKINKNLQLNSLNGLSSIAFFPESIEIDSNIVLTSLSGLNLAQEVNGNLLLSNNDALEEVPASFSIYALTGDLVLRNNSVLMSLSGLMDLNSVAGNLEIISNGLLTNLDDLENLEEIEGDLHIELNMSLVDLIGLSDLSLVNGFVKINSNDALMSLVGLGALNPDSISHFEIMNNALLSICDIESVCSYISLASNEMSIENNAEGCYNILEVESQCLACFSDGLIFSSQSDIDEFPALYPDCSVISGDLEIDGIFISNLDSLYIIAGVNGNIRIINSALLEDLHGLENVTYLDGDLFISNNSALTSLEGIENIDAYTINELTLTNNASLSYCEVESVCSYLGEDIGVISIGNNALNCDSEEEVYSSCFFHPCLEDGIVFSSQAEIDAFPSTYPMCNYIEGDVAISGEDIENLDSLSVLFLIGGEFYINDNDMLSSIEGLLNLYEIEGNFVVSYNNTLSNLDGLENLETIQGDFRINNNDLLNNVSSLNQLTTVSGELKIWQNDVLSSLEGLDNIDPTLLTSLVISDNMSLSLCAIESVCDYISSDVANVTVENNEIGCSTFQELEAACIPLEVQELIAEALLSIYPNPAESKITIRCDDEIPLDELRIYNQLGQEVFGINRPGRQINIEALHSGAYIVHIRKSNQIIKRKLIIKKAN